MQKNSKHVRSHYVAVLAATLLFFIGASPGFSQEARSKLRISYPNVSICCLALFAAQQWKTFEQNGLDVEIIQMRSQAANSALASGDIHYVAGVGPNSVAATLRGLPSKAVWFASESLIYSVMARPEFKSLKELYAASVSGSLGSAVPLMSRSESLWKQSAKILKTSLSLLWGHRSS